MGGDASASRNRRLDALAARQHGLVSVSQMGNLGYSDRTRRDATVAGRLVVVRRGVLRLAGAPGSWEGDMLAAVLAAGPDAVASHLSAIRLWRLAEAGDEHWSSVAEVSSGRSLRLAGVRSHFQPVPDEDRAMRFGVPVTAAHRTLLDLGSRVDVLALGVLTDEALRRNLVTLGRLRWTVERARVTGGRPMRGAAALGDVIAGRLPGYDAGSNDWERRMDRLWEEWDLPAAERQYWVDTPNGKYRLDRAIPDLRIAVEWNGYEHHGRRSRFDADSNRRADLIMAGWFPLDFTSRTSPDRICRSVHALVAQRRLALQALGR